MSNGRLFLFAAVLAGAHAAWCGIAPLVPIEALGRQADLVVEATVAGVLPGPGQSPGTVQLTAERWLKGQPGGTMLLAAAPSYTMPQPPLSAAALVGQHGIWFLASAASGNGYDLLTRVQRMYSVTDMFLPVSVPDPQPPTGTLDEQLLAYVVRWYQGLAAPRPLMDDDAYLMIGYAGLPSLQDVDPQAMAASLAPLLSSVSLSQRCVGLAIALTLGPQSSAALASIGSDFGSLSNSPKFDLLKQVVAATPLGGAAVPALATLAAQHSPGLDNTLAQALERIGGKGIAPAMATLLDSPDSEAQLRAARYFSLYALFADAQGNWPTGGPEGPFSTAQTKQHTPNKTSTLTAADYAAFWKPWWAANQAALGFGNP